MSESANKKNYSYILDAMKNNNDIKKELFDNYVDAVSNQSIFELSETEIEILEFIRQKGRKFSLRLVLIKENPINGEIIKRFTPEEKITAKLIPYKHTPYQYVVSFI